ncbi:MAG: cobalt/zinc/cadmium efflux transporter rane fusion protein CzcB family [Myxococcales bacterium]|nr:cobalt/zinc/cadmium efflux transporter rane fusion protein CzcB family [Myxococcales bacterium]
MALDSRMKIWTVALAAALAAILGVLRPWKVSGDGHAAAAAPAPTSTASGRGEVRLSPEALKKNPITLATARRQPLARDLMLVGSMAFDADHYAIVGPLIAGRIVALRAGSGDTVKRGQVLAELESPDVGAAQAAYLEARAKLGAAQSNARREKDLATQHVSSDREREVAEAQAASEEAALAAARQRLESLGFRAADIAKMGGAAGGRVAIRAPIDGVVISREVTLGQAVQAATDAFRVANLQHLWVNLDVYEKDLEAVHVQQKVELRTESLPGRVFAGRIAYIEPHVDDKTRTARVRIEMENENGALRPGQFVSAKLHGEPRHAEHPVLTVPRRALLSVDGKSLLFVQKAEGLYEQRSVEVGASGGELVEIVKGLSDGDPVVSEGAFLLKSELLR